MRATASAAIAAAAGAALLLGRWLAVSYAGLAPTRRSFAVAVGVLLGLVAFGFGMTGRTLALPAAVWGQVFDLLPGTYATVGAMCTVGATVLMECLAVAVSLADPRYTHSSPDMR